MITLANFSRMTLINRDDIARGIETSDAWITERTGIRARHFADPATPASQLAVPAA